MLNRDQLEQVKEFVYLGSSITEDADNAPLKLTLTLTLKIKWSRHQKRICITSAVIGKLSKIWQCKRTMYFY